MKNRSRPAANWRDLTYREKKQSMYSLKEFNAMIPGTQGMCGTQLPFQRFKHPDASKTFFYGWGDKSNKVSNCNYPNKVSFLHVQGMSAQVCSPLMQKIAYSEGSNCSYMTMHSPSLLNTCTSKRASQSFLQLVLQRHTHNKPCLNGFNIFICCLNL